MINNKRGQLAIILIVALVIVAVILVFYLFRDSIFNREGVSLEFSPIFDSYLGCIEEETSIGISLLGTHGGRIDLGDFTPGSEFAPFSSHLTFAGSPIEYWFYLAGNNLVNENVPSERLMETELSDFIESRLSRCWLDDFYSQGFYIDYGDQPIVNVDIQSSEVLVSVENRVSAAREDRSAFKESYEISVPSRLGLLYEEARGIYEKQANEGFLEEYALDVLRYYAPVDGVLVQCTPGVWQTREVVDSLKGGFEDNLAAVKISDEEDYFSISHSVDESIEVNFLYSGEWPTKVEVTPASDELMIVQPIGNQEGLGVVGFCYVPYHFVYDVSFPVMIQLTSGLEIFQFPVVVVIDNNFAREYEFMSNLDLEEEFDLCSFREGKVEVHTYDVGLNPIEAEISYECFDRVCRLGRTENTDSSDAILNSDIPVCVNGFLIAKADGYKTEQVLFSSNSEEVADIILDREYDVEVDTRVFGRSLKTGDTAYITLSNEDTIATAIAPGQTKIKLSEGLYDVQVYVYGSAGVTIPATKKVECFERTDDSILGLFGKTEEECVDIEIPAITIDQSIVGGGKTNVFIFEDELARGKLVVDASELPAPTSLEQMQYNFEIFDSLGAEVFAG